MFFEYNKLNRLNFEVFKSTRQKKEMFFILLSLLVCIVSPVRSHGK